MSRLYLLKKGRVPVPGCRLAVILRLIVAVVGTLLMIASLIELKTRFGVAREQRAIANLVKAGAGVAVFPRQTGVRYYMINLAGCQRCRSNDEILPFVCDIEEVKVLSLAPLPLHEAGRKCLARLGNLGVLSVPVVDEGISPDTYTALAREMKALSPKIDVRCSGPAIFKNPDDGESNSEE